MFASNQSADSIRLFRNADRNPDIQKKWPARQPFGGEDSSLNCLQLRLNWKALLWSNVTHINHILPHQSKPPMSFLSYSIFLLLTVGTALRRRFIAHKTKCSSIFAEISFTTNWFWPFLAAFKRIAKTETNCILFNPALIFDPGSGAAGWGG